MRMYPEVVTVTTVKGGNDNILSKMARRGGAGDLFSSNTKFLGELDSPGNEGTPVI